jgi:hypothetical protein
MFGRRQISSKRVSMSKIMYGKQTFGINNSVRLLCCTACVSLILLSPSQARTRHHYHHHHYHHVRVEIGHISTGRPRAWCGWYMRQLLHVADAAYNLARNWAHWGHATTPHVGAIVVWRHHVGRIVAGRPGAWVINSGNDGHAVRTRQRSIAGAIAFRE